MITKDKYSDFIVKINTCESSVRLKTREQLDNTKNVETSSTPFAYQNFIAVNRLKNVTLKGNNVVVSSTLGEFTERQRDSQIRIIRKEGEEDNSVLPFIKQQHMHLKITNNKKNTGTPSVGNYNPNYSFIERTV